jgi:predicted nucleotidyltransferase
MVAAGESIAWFTYHDVMDDQVERRLERLVGAARQDSQVLAVLLFGSRARGDAHEGSDVDVCLVLEPGTMSPLEVSRKRLDYLVQDNLDLVIFQQLPLHVRRRVLQQGKVLFSRDEDRLYALALRTVRAFEGFKHHQRRYLDAVARG